MILLDTHVLVRFRYSDRRLGIRATSVVEEAWANGEAAVSAITFWELSMLQSKERLELATEMSAWRRRLLADGLSEIPIDGEIGLRAGQLPDLHGDPADRIIVATAQAGHTLVTSDRRILDWSGTLDRIDARR